METIELKLQAKVNQLASEIEQCGRATFLTCDHPEWDSDFNYYRVDIASALRRRGYKSEISVQNKIVTYTFRREVVLS